MPPPYSPRVPTGVSSFIRKWNEAFDPARQTFGEGAVGPVIDIDLDRVRQGQIPLSSMQTILALRAAQTQKAITKPPEPKGGLFGLGRLLSKGTADLRHIAMSIPRLPKMLVEEAAQLPKGAAQAAEGIVQGDIEKIATAPGFRMLPGAYVAEALAAGEPERLTEHPLFTLLDVAPFAGKAVGQLPRVAAQTTKLRAAREAVPSPFRLAYREYVPERVKPFRRYQEIADFAQMKRQGDKAIIQASQEYLGSVSELAKSSGIEEPRMVTLTTRAKLMGPDERTRLPLHEQRFLDGYDAIVSKLGEVGLEAGGLYRYKGELYPMVKGQGTLFQAGEKVLASRGVAEVLPRREELLGQQTVRVEAARDAQVQHEAFNAELATSIDKLRNDILEASAETLDSPLSRINREVFLNKRNPVARAVALLDSGLPLSASKARAAQKALLTAVKRLEEAYRRRPDWVRAETKAIEFQSLADDLNFYVERTKQVNRLPSYEKELATSQRIVEREAARRDVAIRKMEEAYRKTPPARFAPLVDEIVHVSLQTLADQRVRDLGIHGEALRQVQKNLDDRLYQEVPVFTTKEINQIRQEVAENWVYLKEAGYNPSFVHSVGPEQVAGLRFPAVYPERVSTPTQYRQRTRDAKPSINNMELSVKVQAMELIRSKVTGEVVDAASERWGRTQAELIEMYRPQLESMRGRVPPGVDARVILESLWAKDGWTLWTPEKVIPWARARVTSQSGVYVPGWLNDTLKKMYPAPSKGFMRGVERTTQVFRTSILPLSPRWHLYNIIGGAIMLGLRDPGAFVHAREAYRMAQATKQGLSEGVLPIEVARGMGQVPVEDAMWHYAAGGTQGRLWKEVSVARGFRNVIDASFRFNEFVDSWYRSMAFLYGKSRGERLGLHKTAAYEAGIREANTVLQNWDRMTPVERQILRNVFPFYGWMKHILSYTMALPIDHPMRMSIVSNFARNEWEDWGSGIPERFFQMFVIGRPDKYGNTTAINFRGSNPFSDVANYMTMAGFVNQLNPLIGGFLESVGINAATGKADLYPNLTYDSTTGRVTPQGRQLAPTLLFNILPGAEPLLSAFGIQSDELRSLKINNPEAYGARMRSAVGLPPLPTRVNFRREAALAELSRDRAAQAAFAQARKTGNYADAYRYPSLRPLLDLLNEAPDEFYEPYRVPAERIRYTERPQSDIETTRNLLRAIAP